MRSLDIARDSCDRYHPGLLKALAAVPFGDREARGSSAVGLLREHGGVGLLVPAEYGGHAADPVEAVRVMRAIGSLSPSLAAAATMHHFTVAMLYSLAEEAGRLTDAQLALLKDIVPGQRLLASGWAEGRTEQNILSPAVTARPVDGGYRLDGAKKPCSLSRSMSLLTASIAVPRADGARELALALVPADSPGLSVHPFWAADVLAAAESDEVRLEDVFVPDDLVVRTSADDPGRLDDLQTAGFIWFELLVTAGYAGAMSTLAERVLERGRGSISDRTSVAIGAEAAFALVEGTARAVRDGLAGEAAVASVLVARYAVQTALSTAGDQALELLGGLDFIRAAEHARLVSGIRALAFHPPSRSSSAEALSTYLGGGELQLS
ncbi:acyl-CoA dehydrogenase family protein [Streptomyces sp. DASNCL29]|uniref:acyl-CoA dehydrogenase family protein n=1 Tax=Streptomyces sp. DASNCL29 TaxID=2583819 RepID=UPI00110FB8D5|nr:acyl-CoA dehydrogenase family protein [Streptomyces sp. DASNCL29]TMU98603.1 acyl-CoA dehydrogenase [Streptomyces sp. DASNCL29]